MDDPATPEPVIPSSAPPSEIDAAAVRRVWDEILAMVGQKSKKVAAWAREATVRDIDGKTLVLTFRHSFHARALSEQPDLISEAAYEVLGIRWQIRCEMAGDQRPISSPPASSRPAAPAAQPPSKPSRPNGQTSTAPQAAAPGGADDWPEPAALGGRRNRRKPNRPPRRPHRPRPPADPRAAARAAAVGPRASGRPGRRRRVGGRAAVRPGIRRSGPGGRAA